jgi:hypothetical protein
MNSSAGMAPVGVAVLSREMHSISLTAKTRAGEQGTNDRSQVGNLKGDQPQPPAGCFQVGLSILDYVV